MADALRGPEGTDPEKKHDDAQENRKREGQRVTRLGIPRPHVLDGVSEEQKREEQENAPYRLVPDDSRGTHHFRDNMRSEPPGMLDFYQFCGSYNVSEFQKD